MGLEATWSLVDIPSDARDAAQAAARREGLSVGEWLTRRILRRFSELNAREQEDAFVQLRNHVAQLAYRLDLFEGQAKSEPMREALVKLHQGLARLNEELVRSAGHSAIQISQLSSSLETLNGSMEELRGQDVQSRDVFERRMAQLQEFVDGMNLRQSAETRAIASRVDSLGGTLAESRNLIAGERSALERLEEDLSKADARYASALRIMHGKFDELSGRVAQAASAAESAAALEQRIASLGTEIGNLDACRRNDAELAAAKFEKLTGSIQELQTDTGGMCGALDRRVLLVQQALTSVDSRQGEMAQSLAQHGETTQLLARSVESLATQLESVHSQSVQSSAGLERRMGELEHAAEAGQSANTATDNRFAAVEQQISQLANQAASAETGVAALLPRSQAMQTELAHLGRRLDVQAATQRQSIEELKASLFEQTLNALGDKLEAESRKQQSAIAELKTGLLDELSHAFDQRLEADEHRQQDAIAQLQASFASALHALGETFESEARRHHDAIAELKASLTAAPTVPAAAEPSHDVVQATAPAEIHAAEDESAPRMVAASPMDAPAQEVHDLRFWKTAQAEAPVLEPAAAAEPPDRAAVVEEHFEQAEVSAQPAEPMPDHAAVAEEHFEGAEESLQPASLLTASHDSVHADEPASLAAGFEQLAPAMAMARDNAEAPPPGSYLSAARQSLQAAAAAPAEPKNGAGNSSILRFLRSLPLPGKQKGQTTSYALLAGIGLVAVLAVVVGALQLSKRSAPPASMPLHAARAAAAAKPAPRTPTRVAAKKAVLLRGTSAVTNEDRVEALAKGGDAQAQLLLGLRELAANKNAEAANWLERAAIQGEPVGQYRIATLYASGRGVAADKTKAFRWYLAAAQAGNRKAMSNLAVAYAQGDGTARNPQEAGRWFLKAAQLGLPDAQFDLAILYERGLGVPQNLTDAYRWYVIAAKAGDKESKDRVDALSSQLSGEDRAAAETAAAEFKPQPVATRANEAQ
jgi:localization factor PodJL